jgi:hypothetical protein
MTLRLVKLSDTLDIWRAFQDNEVAKWTAPLCHKG